MEFQMRAKEVSLFSLIVLSALVAGQSFARAQGPSTPRRSVWDGVYSEEQAKRGLTYYEDAASHCSVCHKVDLAGAPLIQGGGGIGSGPALKGDAFTAKWEHRTVDALFGYIRDRMPRGEVTFIPDEKKIDIVAYLLKANGYPAGPNELKIDTAALKNIDIVSRDVAKQVRNFARVQTVGCLAPGADGSWTLTSATAPSIAETETPTDAQLKDATSQQLGTGKFKLLSVGGLGDLHLGERVLVSGFLYRAPSRDRIDLTSLRKLNGNCSS